MDQLESAESESLLAGESPLTLEKCNYTFVYKNKPQTVMGMAPSSHQDTYKMVRKMYPVLKRYPTENIHYSSPMNRDSRGKVTEWVRITEDAWTAGFKPEGRILVELTNPPWSISDWVFNGIAAIFFGFFALLILFLFVMMLSEIFKTFFIR